MLPTSAGEEKPEGEGYSAALKHTSNNVYSINSVISSNILQLPHRGCFASAASLPSKWGNRTMYVFLVYDVASLTNISKSLPLVCHVYYELSYQYCV